MPIDEKTLEMARVEVRHARHLMIAAASIFAKRTLGSDSYPHHADLLEIQIEFMELRAAVRDWENAVGFYTEATKNA